ncbi:hypothetical protein BGZ60DRAFT_412075 [Tricladium varicosporioides]|nr:hypothetical protein BGZ60DRAFT_412075 [Hymenoscyphus varicosporioides]
MPTGLIFCTAQVPAEVLEDFLTQSTRPKTSSKDPWILVRSPEEGIIGPELTKPVTAFESRFENASAETLQVFVKENISLDEQNPNSARIKFDIWPDDFIELDERSTKDGTCIFHHYHEESEEDEESEDRDENEDEGGAPVGEWMTWRVKFLAAWNIWSGFWHRSDLMLEEVQKNTRNYYVDENGILQDAGLENDVNELPDLEERVPYGPDPVHKEVEEENGEADED